MDLVKAQRDQLIEHLSEVRRQKGMSQKQLEETSGVKQPVIARLERGSDSRIPSLELLGRVAHALGKEIVIDFKTGHQH